jgi:BolA protein
MNTYNQIRARLEQRFKPLALELRDESQGHAGHAGAQTGGGHFHLHIVADEFATLSKLKRHRLVYEALGELMQREIHALSIEALAPEERARARSQI